MSQNQGLCALVFLYNEVLKVEMEGLGSSAESVSPRCRATQGVIPLPKSLRPALVGCFGPGGGRSLRDATDREDAGRLWIPDEPLGISV